MVISYSRFVSTPINTKILYGAISIVIIISAIVVLNTNANDDIEYFEPLFLPTDVAELYTQSQFDSTSCMTESQIQKSREVRGINFELPQTLPIKYKLKAIYDQPYSALSVYSFDDCDFINPGTTKGTLEIISVERDALDKHKQAYYQKPMESAAANQTVQESSELRIASVMAYIERDKEKLDRDIYQTRTINGHIAYGHDPGYVYDKYWDENGNLLYRQLIEFPGQIQFVDEDFSTGYVISGMFSFSELVSIAESISE